MLEKKFFGGILVVVEKKFFGGFLVVELVNRVVLRVARGVRSMEILGIEMLGVVEWVVEGVMEEMLEGVTEGMAGGITEGVAGKAAGVLELILEVGVVVDV